MTRFSLLMLVATVANSAFAGDRSATDSERLVANGRQVSTAARIQRGVAYVKVDSLRSALASSRSGDGSLRVDGSKLLGTGASGRAVRNTGTISTGVIQIDGDSYVPWSDVVTAAGGSLAGSATSGGTQTATLGTSCGSCIIDPIFIVDPAFIIDPGF